MLDATKIKKGLINKKIIDDAIYGVAVGDALGVPYEFKKREQLAENPCVGMVGYGTFNKPAGTWSDDTSMTLASLAALSQIKTLPVDYSVVMQKFCDFGRGEYTIDGIFDIGETCLNAIIAFSNGTPARECGSKNIYSNGNGALMRIMPAALFSLHRFGVINVSFLKSMTALTHAHGINLAACLLYSMLAEALIKERNWSKLEYKKYISSTINDISRCIYRDAEEPFKDLTCIDFYTLPQAEIISSGYVVETLKAAVWCFFNTSSYAECVLKAVNLGGDTDTVAAVAGGLAGLFYGKENIPKEWLKALRGKSIIDSAINNFERTTNLPA